MRVVSEEETYRLMQEPCPVEPGTRVRLTHEMAEDPDPIPVGATGTVTGGNGLQMHVRWDNGRTLHLLPFVDRWEVVT